MNDEVPDIRKKPSRMRREKTSTRLSHKRALSHRLRPAHSGAWWANEASYNGQASPASPLLSVRAKNDPLSAHSLAEAPLVLVHLCPPPRAPPRWLALRGRTVGRGGRGGFIRRLRRRGRRSGRRHIWKEKIRCSKTNAQLERNSDAPALCHASAMHLLLEEGWAAPRQKQ